MKKRILSCLMALALCLTLLPATALAEDGHAPHCLCGTKHNSNITHGADDKTAFKNANWLASSVGELRVGSPGGSTYGAPLTKMDNYVILNEGYYYLSYTADGCDRSYVRSSKTIKITGNVTICLNDKQIEKVVDNTGSVGPVFEVPAGSTLTLTDCTGSGQIIGGSNGSGVYVNGGTLNLYSGQITKSEGQTDAKSNKYGGGVYVNNGGTFNMYGGAITGNHANYGGGVYVKSGTFNMYGGDITRNSASYGGGAGVYVEKNGTFIMNNAARVTDNTIGYGSTGGAGVYVNGGKFEMNGNASVTSNTANNSGGSCGGGVYVDMKGTFTMNGDASVTGNTANNRNSNAALNGAGVYVNSGTFEMNGNSKVTGNAASGNKSVKGDGGGVYVDTKGNFNMNGEATSVSNNTATGSGGGVYVGGAFTVTGSPTVMGNKVGAADNNVYLDSKTITIGNTLTGSENSIGVTTNTEPSAEKIVIAIGSKDLGDGDVKKFKSDRESCEISVDVTDGKQLVLTKIVVPHTHRWSYEKDGKATIKVTCTNTTGDCAYRTTPATVTISTAQTVYDCAQITEAPKATLTHSANWPEGPDGVEKAQESAIEYYKSLDDGISYTARVTDHNELKKPGKYVAQLSFNGKYLEAHFSVVDNSKQNPTYTPPTAKTPTYNGQAQALITEGTAKNGTMQYCLSKTGEYSPKIPMATNAGEYTVYYKVVGASGYSDTAVQSILVRINKAKPTGEPIYTKITAAKKTLADAVLKPNTSWPTGTVKWELENTTEIKANTAYKWIFTPTGADADNYTTADGTITLYSVSTGGGSSSGGYDSNPIIKTETKNNPDGSTTKTETRKDGSVTQTTTGKDGSTGTVKTDKNGKTEMNAKLSAKAVEDAKKSGEPVKAPVEVEASRNSGTAPTVKVELPQNSGKTEVEIPVSNAKPGTVAVLVHADGTEEILKASVPTENGIRLTVDGSATVKIIDNSKDFVDTRNHWAREEIDFVSARELVNGMSATRYAPDATATRAQLWTILARQNDANLSGGNTWYEKAQLWSKDKGISDGTNPGATITRAQMVTMLWRTMGQPAATDKVSFADVPADSYYAQAVAWAVEGGITQGVGGDRFDPNATCTRAQIAAFLARSMK